MTPDPTHMSPIDAAESLLDALRGSLASSVADEIREHLAAARSELDGWERLVGEQHEEIQELQHALYESRRS
jgi:hypothetical protein